jgi:ubiquitin carboxyl-terminal hydrolase 4/11
LPRRAIARGRNQEISVELHPPRLRVIRLTSRPPSLDWKLKSWEPVSHPILDVSTQTTIHEMCREFATATASGQTPVGPYRVWKVKTEFDYPELPYEIMKKGEPKLIESSDKTIEEEGIQDEDSFTVEFKEGDDWIVDTNDFEPPPLFGGASFFDKFGSSSSSVTSVKPAAQGTGRKINNLFGNKDKEKALEPGILGLGNMWVY